MSVPEFGPSGHLNHCLYRKATHVRLGACRPVRSVPRRGAVVIATLTGARYLERDARRVPRADAGHLRVLPRPEVGTG